MCPAQVVAGVLQKYVNITKGFRDRLFVLADDKLLYFKVGFPNPHSRNVMMLQPPVRLSKKDAIMQLSGKHAINVQEILDHFDPTAADTTLIGAKILLIQKEHARKYAAFQAPS